MQSANRQRGCKIYGPGRLVIMNSTILDFLLYLAGRLSADPLIDPNGDGEDIVNMKLR